VEPNSALAQYAAQHRGGSPQEPTGRIKDAGDHLVRRQQPDDFAGRVEQPMPLASSNPWSARQLFASASSVSWNRSTCREMRGAAISSLRATPLAT
jgi:hypothetical protein